MLSIAFVQAKKNSSENAHTHEKQEQQQKTINQNVRDHQRQIELVIFAYYAVY